MKKLIFLAVMLFAFASCSRQVNEPVIDKDLVEVDCHFSHITESGEIYVYDMTRSASTMLKCPKCESNSWKIYRPSPLMAECTVCGLRILWPSEPQPDPDPEEPGPPVE